MTLPTAWSYSIKFTEGACPVVNIEHPDGPHLDYRDLTPAQCACMFLDKDLPDGLRAASNDAVRTIFGNLAVQPWNLKKLAEQAGVHDSDELRELMRGLKVYANHPLLLIPGHAAMREIFPDTPEAKAMEDKLSASISLSVLADLAGGED